jgi:hypothetical protein
MLDTMISEHYPIFCLPAESAEKAGFVRISAGKVRTRAGNAGPLITLGVICIIRGLLSE